ncbi:MAG: enoyl-CoA hydratase/isomerase family protein [Gammaproteobacteria bacterium]|nr:enoyl-CoA hydratase/isomerase family protein [Gammaproteobacteria bacterium]
MKFEHITLDINKAIATVHLNRPEIHNAFDERTITELIEALTLIEENSNVRLMLLKAQGKSFSAGADLNWMQRMVQYDYKQNLDDAKQLALLMHRLHHLQKPSIAVVQGAAFGGGVGLISCCDIALATDSALFCLSETRLGLIPSVISPYVISAVGERTARRYYLTAERFDAIEAQRIGLVHAICPVDELEKTTDYFAAQLLQNSPAALTAAKHLISATSRGHIDKAMMDDTAHRIAAIRISKEGQEGLRAFLEKRKPSWSS